MIKSFLLSAILITGSVDLIAQSPPAYEIYALKYFGLLSVPVSELALGAPRKDTMNMFFMYWLIRGNKVILLILYADIRLLIFNQ